ncbi:hypothetical protein B0H16DRAFT_1300474 [Mycena metata]|uniref:SWIM-type domain-containing protein n=1 Tax=Mycena metata TaxID=1033252 RepID=A0AAD7NXF3_9AGAR|nr:hypothetical protein B0H16DRAFT_1300474 [Mycena metata]
MINTFENDRAYISTKWLLRQIVQRGLQVKHLIRITHRATSTVHYIALLRDGRYLCDCCMEQNLGLVCRHYFLAWVTIKDLAFHLSFIRSRWLQDPSLDLASLPAITKTHEIRPEDVRMVIQPIPSLLKPTVSAKKTLHAPVTAHPTETLPARDVFHEIQTAIRPLMAHVETREQVDDLLRNLDGIR